MTTLIRMQSSDGCGGSCDSRCYNAKTPVCKCICQGANHGVGLKQAVDNCRLMAEEWLEQYGQHHPGASGQLTLPEAQEKHDGSDIQQYRSMHQVR